MDVEAVPRRHLLQRVVSASKKLLPAAVIREVEQYRSYEKNERRIYARIRISNGLGFAKREPDPLPKTVHSLLFVCFGNIMRSPMCEALLKRELSGFDQTNFAIESAGLNATPGRVADPWAITAAKDFGISLADHRARAVTAEMIQQADVIFAMDYKNQVQLLSRWPAAKKKIRMMGWYADEGERMPEIRDPYYIGLEGTRDCYRILTHCIRNLAREICRTKLTGQITLEPS